MDSYSLSIVIKWIHLMATVAWIGGMFTNFFIYLPVMGKILDPPTMGKLLGAVMKRFKVMVYISIGVFLLTGILLGLIHKGANDTSAIGDLWIIILFVKVTVFTAMVILVIYAFEILAPKVAKIAADGPSPKLIRIRKSQMSLAFTGFLMGIIILALSASF